MNHRETLASIRRFTPEFQIHFAGSSVDISIVKAAEKVKQIAAPSVPTPQMESERRKSQRFGCQGTAEVIVLGGALRFTGQVQDLSAAGCCIVTEALFSLERGTRVEVMMVVNGQHFRVAAGVRAHHKTQGVGLEFVNVSARSARYIRDLIAELEAKNA